MPDSALCRGQQGRAVIARILRNAVVVVTGASSGIGRATALAFAHEGARLVLAARSDDALLDVVRDCERLGGSALAVHTDTTDPAAMRHLATRAASFGDGRIDIWINNAGIASFGRFLDVPADAHDQVIRVNLIGYLHGAHAALPYFERQGQGVLINVVSMAAWAPTPLAASYSASKFGNRGLSETLRVELAGSGKQIHVCDLYPAFVDTPMLEHTANFEGIQINAVPPVVPVDRVAARIVSIARRPRPTSMIGVAVPLATSFHALLPGLFRRAVGTSARLYLALAPAAPKTGAGLYAASPGAHGATGNLLPSRSRMPRATGAALAAGAALGLGGLAAWRLLRARSPHPAGPPDAA